jgi:UDP-3-O-[3-hydroxymyristoyl] N-acetylglucosamine deacetylase
MQQTLAAPVTFEGVGIHSGKPGRIRVLPAPEDFGVRFCLGGVEAPALAEAVLTGARCTVLGAPSEPGTGPGVDPGVGAPTSTRAPGTISTVEHLMAALYGLAIDNARIEVEGPEIPILDGSAAPFTHAFLEAGLKPQNAEAPTIRLTAPIWLQPGEPSQILALPADHLTLTVATDFRRPFMPPEVWSYSLAPQASDSPSPFRGGGRGEGSTPTDFARDLAPARTFCFEDEVAAIRAAGLGGGGSIENTIVVSETGTSTPLRFPNELARHKALDLLGDLALVGGRLAAHVIAVRAGHALHVALAAEIRRQAPGAQPRIPILGA